MRFLMKLKFCCPIFYNGHEADLNCATVLQKIRDFDEHRKSIYNFVKSMLFLIKTAMRQIWIYPYLPQKNNYFNLLYEHELDVLCLWSQAFPFKKYL